MIAFIDQEASEKAEEIDSKVNSGLADLNQADFNH